MKSLKNRVLADDDLSIKNKSKLLPGLTQQNRIDIVNEIIQEIAKRGRKFFARDGRVAKIFLRNGRLYMFNEYNETEMCLSTKNGYPPKGWHHGGTLWALTKDFKDYISNGDPSNHNHGHGGLYCSHWGYSNEDMVDIQETARVLGYL